MGVVVNKKQLAKRFKVSINTIDAWLLRGCPYRKKGSCGQSYQFSVQAVAAWRKNREAEAEARRPQYYF